MDVLLVEQAAQLLSETVAGEPAEEAAVSAEACCDPGDVIGSAARNSGDAPRRIDEEIHQRLASHRDHGACGSSCLAPVMIATASSIVVVAGVTTPTQRPRRWMWTRSATSKTCGMLWLMRITGIPCRRSSLISSSTWPDSRTPSAAVGSSR